MGTPVSGPGGFSQRTDKAVSNANSSLPNAQYGENRDYQEQKTAAPMGQSPGGMDIGSLMGAMRPEAIGLGEESQQPDTPVTDGAALGPGAGTEALGPSAEDPSVARNASWMMAMLAMADTPGSSDSARNLVRTMKANMNL
jgi:hypothetical protein